MIEALAVVGWIAIMAVILLVIFSMMAGIVVSNGFGGKPDPACVIILLVALAALWLAIGISPLTVEVAR